MSGKMEGRRFASMLLPAPGAPHISTLCPPAAAISSARFTADCPLTSEKSKGNGCLPAAPNTYDGIRLGYSPVWFRGSRRKETRDLTSVTAKTSIPAITEASGAFSAGTKIRLSPDSFANSVIGSTPLTAQISPDSDSSPINAASSKLPRS